MTTTTEPFAAECDNESEYWTCPGCYADLTTKHQGTFECPECKRLVACTMTSKPVWHAELVESEDDDE